MTISSQYSGTSVTPRISEILFQDGTRWDLTEGADQGAVINGTAKADTLTGTWGDDIILAGAGADTIRAQGGTNWIDPGAGNDTIYGGWGNDTYVFGLGYGRNIISDHAGQHNVITLHEGIAVEDVRLKKDGNSLVATLVDGSSMTIYNQYEGAAVTARINELHFADGNRVDLTGGLTLYGSAGNDTIHGTGQGDTFIAGTGTDRLYGTAADETYVYDRGDSLTTIFEQGGNDQVLFGAGLAAEDLWFMRRNGHLDIHVIGTEDRLRISDWFNGDAYRVETFETSSGHSLSSADVDRLVQAMAAFAPPEAGETSLSGQREEALVPLIAEVWKPAQAA